MPKRLYKCEVCGHRKSLTKQGKKQIVCIDCVERDLLALNDRIKRLEDKVKELSDIKSSTHKDSCNKKNFGVNEEVCNCHTEVSK